MANVVDTSKFEQKDYNTLDLNSNFLKLINVIEKDAYQLIFLTDSKNHLNGFVSSEHIIKSGKNEIALKKLQTKLPLFKEFDHIKMIKHYLDKNTLLIPIVDQKETITTVYNIYKIAKDYLFDLNFESEKVVENIPFSIYKNEKIDHLMSELKRTYLDGVIVKNEEDNRIFGYIESKKLLNLLIKPESTSRGEKKGEKLKFEGTIENLIENDNRIIVNQQNSYNATQLIERMEQNKIPLLYVKDANNEITGMIKLKRLLNLSLASQNVDENSITVSVLSAPDDNIEQIAKKKISALIERHSNFFNTGQESEGTVRFHKIENQSQKGKFKYETDIRISFGKGKDSVFAVKSDDWGAEKSLNKSYSKISRLISDKRKISRDSYQKKENLEE